MQLMNVMTAVATATPAPSHFSGDPKTLSSGSSFFPTARSIAKTQHVPLIHMPFLLYIVFLPRFVTRRAAAENSASLIP
ncbi:hypothetical protein [Klebsiella michiganensis]|uniref:hypothetical protein n=1 Tax=Klebsiella michiganensis TaxID=1134687 RepID=UPI00137536C9|nr:hypothetical protein [Klebsiella michiganensis]